MFVSCAQIIHTIVTDYDIKFPTVIDRVAGGSALSNLSLFTVFKFG
jgi:hypothetical protein